VVRLPALRGSVSEPLPAALDAPHVLPSGKRVLVVDDNRDAG